VFLRWQMYCSIDIQTSRTQLNTIYVIHERTHDPFHTHPDAHMYWSRRVGMLCAAAGSICISDFLFLLFAGVCVVRCVIVLCVGMVDVLVASVMIWYLYWERR